MRNHVLHVQDPKMFLKISRMFYGMHFYFTRKYTLACFYKDNGNYHFYTLKII